ncbi:MAG TPA: acyltransferase [Anaerolineales bacterium]|nr:acyltransferase [Anaerolineales bacterium]
MVSDQSLETFRESTPTYLSVVDGVRGIAILLVLWYHAPFLFRDLPEFSVQHSPWTVLGPFWRMSLGGWIGVDLFFVVSGFLITSILLRVREEAGFLLAFWGRRALRILPLAVLYLVGLAILIRLNDPLNILPRFDAWPWYAFYMGNIHISIYGWQPLAVMILWSLAIEEQFYLVWPFLVQLCKPGQILRWSIGCMVVAPIFRVLTLSTVDYPATYVLTFCRLDALAAGAVVAVLCSAREWREQITASCRRLAIPALAMIMLILLVPFSPSLPQTRPWFFSVFGYSCIAVSFAILLVVSLQTQGSIKDVLTSRALTFLGKRCYGLYLWHILAGGVAIVAIRPWNIGFYGHLILWLALLVMMASVSWLCFEEPILRLKRFLPYTGRQSSEVEAASAGLIGISR